MHFARKRNERYRGCSDSKRTRARFAIVAMLFVVTAVNYADRATLSLAGPALSKELGLDAVTMGYIFSAFGWSYVIGQLPGGWLLDRFGSKIVYFASIFIWSMFTLLQGGVSFLTATPARRLWSFCTALSSWLQ
jgi:ACS family glucarate transporter-like MFS transporter